MSLNRLKIAGVAQTECIDMSRHCQLCIENDTKVMRSIKCSNNPTLPTYSCPVADTRGQGLTGGQALQHIKFAKSVPDFKG